MLHRLIMLTCLLWGYKKCTPVPHDWRAAMRSGPPVVKAEDVATDLAPYMRNPHLGDTLGYNNASTANGVRSNLILHYHDR